VHKTTVDEAPQLFQLATLYTLVFWICDGALIDGRLGDLQVLALWGTLFGAALTGRHVARRLAAAAAPSERCLFIGDARSYARLRSKLDGDDINAELVGRLSLQRVSRGGGDLGARTADARELEELIAWTDAHRVIIEPQTLPAEDMLDLVRAAKAVGVRVSLLPRVLDVVGTSVVFDDLGGMTLLGVRRFGLTRSSRLVKRSFDLVGASLGVLAVAPALVLIAVLVKLDSRGPVLFRQERVGRDGRRFRIYKFRTMCSDAEERKAELLALNECDGGLFKIAEDPRVTRVGRLLRRTSLDELPQLFNVITGDMSLVGPRPLVVDEDERITGLDRRRLALTPGMTGHWQIAGSARVPLHEMVKIDYLYVAGWSLWSDLKILLRTVPYMVSRRGM
jgi:exopolysaccharide biosynthesis polyprenyl glycosylphosphotransferase